MIGLTIDELSILRIVGVAAGVRVSAVSIRRELRAFARVNAFAFLFQHVNVSEVVTSCSLPFLDEENGHFFGPLGLLFRVLSTNVKVFLHVFAMFIGREQDVCGCRRNFLVFAHLRSF